MEDKNAVKRSLARSTDQTYLLEQGESLAKVAHEAYGTPRLWRSIYDHNRDTLGRNPKKIKEDVTITVPSLNTIIARKRSRTQVLMAFEANRNLAKSN